MNKCLMILALLVLVATAWADGRFLDTLPADDFATAGLKKLTPDELTRLETLVQRYKTGTEAEVRQQADAKALAAQQEAEKKIIAAETKAREAEVRANEAAVKVREAATMAGTAKTKKQPGWFTALLTLKKAGKNPDKEEPLENRLVGDFEGWSGRSIFKLENGSRWVQQNKMDNYIYSPVLHSPKVKITPAAITGFWLEIEGVNLCVRVLPLEVAE